MHNEAVMYKQSVSSRRSQVWLPSALSEYVFYVPERSIMHLTVSTRFLISSGREGE